MIIKRLIQNIFPLLILVSCVYQRADMHTDMTVDFPKFTGDDSPVVLFDVGHGNFHDIETTYKPFATLLANDGIGLSRHLGKFSMHVLKNVDLLIVSNAMGEELENGELASAFTENEIQVLSDWITHGGSLLLIADHDPFGSASADLARAWGVGMESVWTVDTLRLNPEIDRNTWLEFTQLNGGLGHHPIVQGDSENTEIDRVITFTGQSLSYDSTWTSVLSLSNSAQNYYTRADSKILNPDPSTFFAVPGQSQLIARQYGEGRIVITGEAAMFTAQEVRIFFKTMQAGFNYSGYDNKKLVLNIIHWLLIED